MNVLLVDDHHLIRAALVGVFEELVPAVVMFEAESVAEAWQQVEACPDLHLAVVDLALPDRDGFALLADLRRLRPALPCLILSAETRRDLILRALDLGAVGFIPKSGSRAVMVNAVRLVLAGGTYVPPEALSRGGDGHDFATAPQPRDLADLGLTERQTEVLALLIKGRSNKWIGRTLDLAEPTVKHHVTAILKALKVSNRTEATIAVAEMKLELPKLV